MERIRIRFVSRKASAARRIDEMKLGSACAVLVAGLVLLLAGGASAYSQYSEDGDDTFCRECHGNFRSQPYISRSDGMSWEDDLHDVHRNTMLNGDCDTCHSTGPRFPVLIGSSIGGTGLPAIACAGCHGRAEDGIDDGSIGYGAGLRQNHWVGGITVCVNCHMDADPAEFTPVGEDILPPYYSTSDAAHPLIPGDPCNLMEDGFLEDYAASTLGLDNDGDGLYDEADLIQCPEPGVSLMLSVGVGFLLVIGRRRISTQERSCDAMRS
jgi:hypothetical protein